VRGREATIKPRFPAQMSPSQALPLWTHLPAPTPLQVPRAWDLQKQGTCEGGGRGRSRVRAEDSREGGPRQAGRAGKGWRGWDMARRQGGRVVLETQQEALCTVGCPDLCSSSS